MPFYLNDRDFSKEMLGVHSVLILPCGFCPAVNLAVREASPFIDVFHTFMKTPAYEEYIHSLRSRLEGEGVRAEIYPSKMPVICMWPAGLREDLARQAAGYDALIVLGCDAAVETARQCLKSSGCRIISGMEAEGIMNVVPSFHFPFKICLEMSSVSRFFQQDGPALSEYSKICLQMEGALEECCKEMKESPMFISKRQSSGSSPAPENCL